MFKRLRVLPLCRARRHLTSSLVSQVTASEVLEIMATRSSVSDTEIVAIADSERHLPPLEMS